MKQSLFVLFVIQFVLACGAQTGRVANPEFDRKIDQLIGYRVPVLSVEELLIDTTSYYFLDAREGEEYSVSHIPGARHIGYDNFELNSVLDIPKDSPILIYCSIGYRSDRIGGRLKRAGYSNVHNLYGSIFEWANRSQPLVNNSGPTSSLHTYNKRWSQWVTNPEIQKTW